MAGWYFVRCWLDPPVHVLHYLDSEVSIANKHFYYMSRGFHCSSHDRFAGSDRVKPAASKISMYDGLNHPKIADDITQVHH
jgi:hypothetical protein